MTEGVGHKQLKERLNSELGTDIPSDEPSKRMGGSGKKKKPKLKKPKDSSDHSHGDLNDPPQERSDQSLSTAHFGNNAKLSEGATATKKSATKTNKNLSSTSSSSTKLQCDQNSEMKSDNSCHTQTDKKQISEENIADKKREKCGKRDKHKLVTSELNKKELGQSQEEIPGKPQKGKENPHKTFIEKSEQSLKEVLGKSPKAREVSQRSSKGESETKTKCPKIGKETSHADTAGNQKNQTQGNNMNNNKPRPIKPGDAEITEEFLRSLAENKMHVLKKPNQKFRNARFFCKLCDFHLDQVEDCMKHMKDNRHCRRKEISEVDAVLRLFPALSESQIVGLTTAVDSMWEVRGISLDEEKVRQKIVTRLEVLLQQHIPDVLLYMYGSSLTGFGLKAADINVDLCSSDKDRKLTFLLKDVHTVMRDKTVDCGFSNVRADFSAKVPVLLITDDASGLVVTMAIHCYSAHCSSELLAIYADMDLRVKKLVVAFRYWAHLCALDRHKDGFIPPQALNIMVIYFLQTITPQVIPIINPPKVSGEDVGDFRQDEPGFIKMRTKAMKHAKDTSNSMSVGELWVRLLRFYSLEFDIGGIVVSIRRSQPVPRNTKPWNCKKLAVEDPYILKKNITRMVNNSRIYEYWQDSIRKAYYYFGLPRDQNGKSLISEEDLKARSLVSDQPEKSPSGVHATQKSSTSDKTKAENCLPDNDTSDLPKDKDSNVVCIAPNPLMANRRQPANNGSNATNTEKQIEPGTSSKASDLHKKPDCEPQMRFCSVSADIEGSDMKEICDRSNSIDLSSTSIIAGAASVLPHTDSTNQSLSSLDAVSKTCESVQVDLSAVQGHGKGSESLTQFARSIAENIIAKAVSTVTFDSEDEGIVQDSGLDKNDQSKRMCSSSEVPPSPIIDTLKSLRLTEDSGAGSSISMKTESVSREETKDTGSTGEDLEPPCLYDFDKNYFTDGKGPTLVCTFCEKEGHLKNSCPEDELPEVLNLPEMTENHLKVLSQTLNQVPSEVGLSEESIRWRWQFLQDLQDFINYIYDDAELTLFGSTCNGFGFDKSDMDICMTFSRRNGKKIDKVHVIETLARRLKNYGQLCNVQAISTAKVPIVKFTIRGSQLEGDISLYNTLAQRNTELLKCYSLIDSRVRILGYAIKTFAKVCDIGDASRGSLSSYAYILMMLYYLQQVEPPVIPVLQELYNGKKPELIVEDCDAWFMDDVSKVHVYWPHHGKNKMSVAELWLGFLRFYVEEFNYKEFVVSIRQKDLLTRFEKLWNGNSIAVEDPFDLSHNLGSGLTRKMNNFIFKTFINGRMLYGSPIDQNMELFKDYQCASDYFFDTELLSENRPTNGRGCRRCGKIGHMVKACPLNRKDRDDKEQKQMQQRQQQQQQQHHMNMSQGAQGRLQPVQMAKTKQQDRGYQSPRQNQGHQHYRDRDFRDRDRDFRDRERDYRDRERDYRDRERDYRDRDRWQSNTGGGGSGGHMNNRHHSGGPNSSGNTNRNSSAASGSHTPGPGYGLPGGALLDRPPPPPHQQQHYNQQQQQQHRASYTSHTYHNSSHQQKQQHYYSHPRQQQQTPNQQQQQQHHQQQQLRYQQQEQQRQAAMAVVSGNIGRQQQPPHNPPAFPMQPMMTSTPRPAVNLPPQHQSLMGPPPGFGSRPGGMSPQQHQAPRMRGNLGPGLLPSPAQQYYIGDGANNQQTMNPVVQSLFSNARHQVQSMNSNRYPNQHH